MKMVFLKSFGLTAALCAVAAAFCVLTTACEEAQFVYILTGKCGENHSPAQGCTDPVGGNCCRPISMDHRGRPHECSACGGTWYSN